MTCLNYQEGRICRPGVADQVCFTQKQSCGLPGCAAEFVHNHSDQSDDQNQDPNQYDEQVCRTMRDQGK